MKMLKTLPLLLLVTTVAVLAQNQNPYADLGYEAPIMEIEGREKAARSTLVVFNQDTGSVAGILIIDIDRQALAFYDKHYKLVETRELDRTDVARWLTIDPVRQYASPYVGMGNDPVNRIDPDGAYSKFGAWWRSKFIAGSEHFYHAGEGEWAVSFQQLGKVGNSDLSAVVHVFTEGRIVFPFKGINWVNESNTTYKFGLNSVNDNGMIGVSVDAGSWEIAKLNLSPDKIQNNFSDMVKITSPKTLTQGLKIESMSGDLKMKMRYDFNGGITSDFGLGFPFLEVKVTLDQHYNIHRIRIGSQEDVGKSVGGHAISTSYFSGIEYKPK